MKIATSLFAVLVYAWSASALGAPKIVIQESRWNFGEIYQRQTVWHTFVIRNEGDEPLIISDVKSSCPSCTGAMVGKKVIQPGERPGAYKRSRSARSDHSQPKIKWDHLHQAGWDRRISVLLA